MPLDPLPGPQIQAPQYTPPKLDLPPEGGIGQGLMGKGGNVADIASHFLQGWLQGKQRAEAKKTEMANQNVSGAKYAFDVAQQNAASVMNDSNSTPEQKQQAEQARQAAWKGYLDIAGQYVTPPKKQGKGGAKGAAGAVGDKLKQTFGVEDPHIFSQAVYGLLQKTGPPALPQKSAQEQYAELELRDRKKVDSAIDALADARQKGAPPDQIAKLEQNVRDVSGQIEKPQTPKEKLDNAMAQATMDYQSGKPINEQTKQTLEAQGYIPKPVMPNVFLQDDGKGHLYSVSIDPQTGKTTRSPQPIMKVAVKPDARMEAHQIMEENLNQVGRLLKEAHPDWTPEQISKAKAEAMLAGQFHVKTSASRNLSPKDSQTAISKALNEVFNSNMLDDDEKKGLDAIRSNVRGVGGGGWMLNKDLAQEGFWDKHDFWIGQQKYHGMTKDEATKLDAHVRTLARETMRTQHPDWDEDTINELIPASMAEDRGRFTLEGTPGGGGEGGGKTASMADVQEYAKQNNISVDEAKKRVQSEGFTVQ